MSNSLPCFMLTNSPYSRKKSAPMIGVEVSAMTKIHRNTRLRPKSSVRDRVPKVAMGDPLTSRKPKQSCLLFRSVGEGGTTLTSAPVSIRKRQPELASGKNSRRLVDGPGSLVAPSDRPRSFPTFDKGVSISWLHLQRFDGTNRG